MSDGIPDAENSTLPRQDMDRFGLNQVCQNCVGIGITGPLNALVALSTDGQKYCFIRQRLVMSQHWTTQKVIGSVVAARSCCR
jgi:hypothetical protein